jgi:hypothetical protein
LGGGTNIRLCLKKSSHSQRPCDPSHEWDFSTKAPETCCFLGGDERPKARQLTGTFSALPTVEPRRCAARSGIRLV